MGGKIGGTVLRFIVDRLHVSASYRDVAREIVRRLKKDCPKAERKRLVRRAMEIHRENRQLYADVMGGRLGSGIGLDD